jgi:hypothetical protein
MRSGQLYKMSTGATSPRWERAAVIVYHVRVERGGRYWLVHVVELDG